MTSSSSSSEESEFLLENHLNMPDFSESSDSESDDDDEDDDAFNSSMESWTLEDLGLVVVESLGEASSFLLFDLGPEEMRIPFQCTTAVNENKKMK